MTIKKNLNIKEKLNHNYLHNKTINVINLQKRRQIITLSLRKRFVKKNKSNCFVFYFNC